jgi:hypothetical protein
MTDVLNSNDPLLTELAINIEGVTDQINEGTEHALLVLGAKFNEETSTKKENVETYFAAVGYYDVIEEGLYASLKEQMDQGNMSLFAVLRNVIRDLEDDFNISPEDEIPDDDDGKVTYLQ